MPERRLIISTNPDRLDMPWVRAMLRSSYWGEWLTPEQINGACQHSICFGAYEISRTLPAPRQLGFARVVTDWHTFSSLMDVIVDPERRGEGIGTKLIAEVAAHPAVRGTISILATRDASSLYARFGWLHAQDGVMMRNPDT